MKGGGSIPARLAKALLASVAAAALLAAPCASADPATSPRARHVPPTLPERVLASPAPARARYRASRPGRHGLAVPPHRASGYTQRVDLLPDGRTLVTIVVEPSPLPPGAPWPVPRERRPPEVRRYLETRPVPGVPELASALQDGALTDREVSHRILEWVSTRVEGVESPGHDDDAAATLSTRRGSCVGRSLLAAALLRASGIPARTVHGLLAPREVPPGTPFGSADFVLHRFVESHLVGPGWVLSDPGESIHLVDTRHVVLALDDEPYDPEQQRFLRLTLLGPMGALTPWPPAARTPGAPTLVLRSVLPTRSAPRRAPGEIR